MIRTFLAKGDRGGKAEIMDGLDSVTCTNPPPAAYIATLGMKTYCWACKQEGYIAPRGPRWNGVGPNGKQWALSGDINICGCSPAPMFYPVRERHMTMSFTAEEVARLTGRTAAGASIDETSFDNGSRMGFDEQVRTVANQCGIVGYPYFIETAAGAAHSGRVDARGLLPRVFTDDVASYTVYWGEEALSHEGWSDAE